MISAILIKPDNTCLVSNGAYKAKHEGETDREFYDRITSKNYPDVKKIILREVQDFPPGRMEEWLYNPATDQIDFNEIRLVNWEDLETEMRGIGQGLKNTLGTYYLLFAQAIRDKDEDYLKASYAIMNDDNSINQSLKDNIEDKFISYGVSF